MTPPCADSGAISKRWFRDGSPDRTTNLDPNGRTKLPAPVSAARSHLTPIVMLELNCNWPHESLRGTSDPSNSGSNRQFPVAIRNGISANAHQFQSHPDASLENNIRLINYKPLTAIVSSPRYCDTAPAHHGPANPAASPARAPHTSRQPGAPSFPSLLCDAAPQCR